MIVDEIQLAIESSYECGVFLDFSKAFDTVNYQILIQKLDHYGIRGLPKKWFCSYPSNRKQFVSISYSSSEYRPMPCGVPQGSVPNYFSFILMILLLVLLYFIFILLMILTYFLQIEILTSLNVL